MTEDPLTDVQHRPATLALEDGRIFNGRAAGAITRRGGEVVFNTSLTGYQEVFTDPSYAGQIVCLTYPHIGNVGANLDDEEASRPYIESLIVREFSQDRVQLAFERNRAALSQPSQNSRHLGHRHARPRPSHPQSRRAARHRFHRRHRPPINSSSKPSSFHSWPARNWPAASLATKPTTGRKTPSISPLLPGPNRWANPAPTPTLTNSAWSPTTSASSRTFCVSLVDHQCEVTVVPATTSAEDILNFKPDGVFLSNGPGDPEPVTYAQENIRKLAGRVPIFGICLGHQLCGLALGGKTFKLKFGHHGSNHPVKNLLTNQVEITAQNHGFCVDPESLPSSDVEITHMNLNDHTNEGMRHKNLPLFSVQYHPEASPGPHDSHYLFTQFTDLMKEFHQPGSSRG